MRYRGSRLSCDADGGQFVKRAIGMVCCLAIAIPAQATLVLNLEDYVNRAITQGIDGRQNDIALLSAGYSRRIAFRQTDSPRLTAGYTANRRSVDTNGSETITDRGESSLALEQPFITGTSLSARAIYGDDAKPGLDVTGTQPLYIFVRNPILRTRKRADLLFKNAEDSFASARLSIRSRARSLYYEVILGDESIKVEERKVASAKRLLDVTQALVDAGKLPAVETMRAKIRLQRDDRQRESAVVQYDKAVLIAKNYLRLPLDQDVKFSSRLEFKPFPHDLAKLLEVAARSRPELRTLRRNVELSKLTLEATKEATRPTLNLVSNYTYNEDLPAITRGWNLTGTASWLFFDSFITRDQVRIARLDLEVSELNLENSQRSTEFDVRSAYLDLKKAESQVEEFDASRAQAQRNVEVLRLRFQNGLERIIDVFDAENEMRNLDNEYLALLVNYNRARDTMSQLIGQDVETLP